MKVRLWIIFGGLTMLGLTVITVGCTPEDNSDAVATEDHPAYATTGDLDDVKLGMTKRDVMQIVGAQVTVPMYWPKGTYRECFSQGQVWYTKSKGGVVARVDNYGRRAEVDVNSEPRGARIYADGKLLGTTPLKLSYQISDADFQRRALIVAPLVAAADGCLPSKVQLHLEVDPAAKKLGAFCFGQLFLLERDPNFKPPTIMVQQPGTGADVRTQSGKDGLDYMEQVGRIGIITKTLRAMGR